MSTGNKDENNLWKLVKKGDRMAFENMYHIYYALLMNYGYRFTQQQPVIEEAVQDLFIKIWEKKDVLSEPVSVKNYIYKSFRRILLRLLSSPLQKSLSNSFAATDHDFRIQLTHDNDLIIQESLQLSRAHIETILESLTSRQREVIYLRFFEELDYDEIAKILDMQISGVYKLIYRAIDRLRVEFGACFIFLFCSQINVLYPSTEYISFLFS
jgi:RNA polymerase sigma factor (sigma-70 family)